MSRSGTAGNGKTEKKRDAPELDVQQATKRGKSSDGGAGTHTSLGLEPVSVVAARKEKLKTLMDVAYDIMSSEKAGSMSKANIYDHWLDLSTANKHKYIIQAKQKIKEMNADELSSVQLTVEEIAELGLSTKLIVAGSAPEPVKGRISNGANDEVGIDGKTILSGASGRVSGNADANYVASNSFTRDGRLIDHGDEDNDNGEDKDKNDEDDDDDNYGGGEEGGVTGRKKSLNNYMMASRRSAASLQSMNTSSVLDEDCDELADNEGSVEMGNDDLYEKQPEFFLKAVGSDKYKPPSIGLQYQAVIEPWVNVQDRVGDYAELGERDRTEKESAHKSNAWSLNESGHDDKERSEIINLFLTEAFVILKNTMYSKLIEMTSKRVKVPRNITVGLNPIVDGMIMYLRPDCCETLLQLLHEMKYKVDAALAFLKQQCLSNDAMYIMSWNHLEQERAHAVFAKFGDDASRLAATIPTKRRAEVLDYFFRFMESGRYLESDCNLETYLQQAEKEVAGLNRRETVDEVVSEAISANAPSTCAVSSDSSSKLAPVTSSLNAVENGELGTNESTAVLSKKPKSEPGNENDEEDDDDDEERIIEPLDVQTPMEILQKFSFPDSLLAALPTQLHGATKSVAVEALKIAKKRAAEISNNRNIRYDRLLRYQEEERKENFALMHLQKMKTIAFMLKAKRTLDDVCFTFLMNSLTEYRHFTLSPAELIVRVRWLCNFSRDNPFQVFSDRAKSHDTDTSDVSDAFDALFLCFLGEFGESHILRSLIHL